MHVMKHKTKSSLIRLPSRTGQRTWPKVRNLQIAWMCTSLRSDRPWLAHMNNPETFLWTIRVLHPPGPFSIKSEKLGENLIFVLEQALRCLGVRLSRGRTITYARTQCGPAMEDEPSSGDRWTTLSVAQEVGPLCECWKLNLHRHRELPDPGRRTSGEE